MAMQGDWARQLSEEAAARPRNIFPTNDRSDPTHHGDDVSSTFGAAREVLGSTYARTAILATLAAGIGVAIGIWLGGKREAKRHQSIAARVDVPDILKLAPVLAQLAANPVVRLYAARIVMRQMRKYLDQKLEG
jgi:hypothetical protein